MTSSGCIQIVCVWLSVHKGSEGEKDQREQEEEPDETMERQWRRYGGRAVTVQLREIHILLIEC